MAEELGQAAVTLAAVAAAVRPGRHEERPVGVETAGGEAPRMRGGAATMLAAGRHQPRALVQCGLRVPRVVLVCVMSTMHGISSLGTFA